MGFFDVHCAIYAVIFVYICVIMNHIVVVHCVYIVRCYKWTFVFCRLLDLTRKDEEKRELAAVKNELEAFSYEVRNKLYEEDYEACSTEYERDTIREKLTEIMDWYDEQPLDTGLKVTYIAYSNIHLHSSK